MYEYFFTFGSLTNAQSAVRVLDHYAIPSKLLRTPREIQMQGCSHSVCVRSGYFIQAKDELERKNLRYHKIFCKFADGQFEEVVA